MAKTFFTLMGNSADSRRLADVTPCIATANAHVEQRERGERLLEQLVRRWLEGPSRLPPIPL
jgi:hypothetical protein